MLIDEENYSSVAKISPGEENEEVWGCASPVHKLLGNFLATLGFSSKFPLVEQLLVHWATFEFLFLDIQSHTSATSATIKKCRI